MPVKSSTLNPGKSSWNHGIPGAAQPQPKRTAGVPVRSGLTSSEVVDVSHHPRQAQPQIRNPKHETNAKSQFLNSPNRRGQWFRISSFSHSGLFRISIFGFGCGYAALSISWFEFPFLG
jgi:hypothetical protein